ncbi:MULTISPECIES: serine--tRNA ligase [unclassified Robiginitalea]|uniref:serine--tRNA ligase n=1 Tax=Robiginitalea TaxID=252306 RepID=UPI00234AEC95|nr:MULTISPECIES: serine--tRNA ligase [unclassified Robiginitalea]MDC6353498.1 serine--tRNA ligase [Robiginitalea sp. PM2]MDC6373337.1 serine--tRNA ligase [Robiginitalea sp. SP8]
MLPLHTLRENPDSIAQALGKRGVDAQPMIQEVLELDKQRRTLQTQLDATLAEANTLSREIGNLFKAGKSEEAQELKARSAKLKESSKALTESLNDAADALQQALYQVPNAPHASVPAGTDEEDNEVVFTSGDLPQAGGSALPHWELAAQYDLIDFELGVKITGAGFPVYKGKCARLQRALVSFFLDRNTEAGYQEVQVPHLVNEASGLGTGQLPDKEGQMYELRDDKLFLIPTAEVPVTNMLRDELLDLGDLPLCYTAYTPCFRREAGSYGAHVRGLNRLHQFDKVEIVRVEEPGNSYAALEQMVEHVKGLLGELGLPYRILRLCGGDLGFTSALTYDFEVWSAAQERWLEVSSVSNFEAFQANRLKLRYRDENNKPQLAHTLNGSALALPRILACILEDYQDESGIRIPDVLVPYTGFDRIA